jgi:hypothetical protein
MNLMRTVIMILAAITLTGCTTFTLVAPNGSWVIQKIACQPSNSGNKPRMERDTPHSKGVVCPPLQGGITCS